MRNPPAGGRRIFLSRESGGQGGSALFVKAISRPGPRPALQPTCPGEAVYFRVGSVTILTRWLTRGLGWVPRSETLTCCGFPNVSLRSEIGIPAFEPVQADMFDLVGGIDPHLAAARIPAVAERKILRQQRLVDPQRFESAYQPVEVGGEGRVGLRARVAERRHLLQHGFDCRTRDQQDARAATVDLHEARVRAGDAHAALLANDVVVSPGDRPLRRLASRRQLGNALEVDLPLRVDNADHGAAEIDHVQYKLGREPHVGIDEQQMRGVGLVEPAGQQKIAALGDVGIGDAGKCRIPFAALKRLHQPKKALYVGCIEDLAKGRSGNGDLCQTDAPLEPLSALVITPGRRRGNHAG